MEIISREEARERGLKRYFTGKPCIRGHICERRVDNTECKECGNIIATAGRRKKGIPEKKPAFVKIFKCKFCNKPVEKRRNKVAQYCNATCAAYGRPRGVPLKKFGLSREEYSLEVLKGNVWCNYGKHFVHHTRKPKTKAHYCKDCSPQYNRERLLSRKYGITEELYNQILTDQGGHCALCPSIFDAKDKRKLSVDHDHETGDVRGILCNRCNNSIERLDSSEDWEVRARQYINKYKNKSIPAWGCQ